MKKLTKLLTVLLCVVMCASLMACSSYSSVKATLEDIGYALVESAEDTEAEDMQDESEVVVKAYVFSNEDSLGLFEILKYNVVIVFEFNSTKEMLEFYEDSNTMQGLIQDIQEDGTAEEFYNDLVDKGYAKGNCLIMSTNLLVAGDVCDAIKNS